MKTKNHITVILLLICLSINAQENFYYAFKPDRADMLPT